MNVRYTKCFVNCLPECVWQTLRELRRYALYGIVRFNYIRVRRRLSVAAKSRPIRIAFLVNETSKWKMQSLFDMMRKDERFDPFVIVTIADEDRTMPIEAMHQKLEATYNFFSTRDMSVAWGYDIENDKTVALDSLCPDLVFYQQPWGIELLQYPNIVSRFALTCYVPYYVPNYGDVKVDCMLDMHRMLWTYFTLNESWRSMFVKAAHGFGHIAKFVSTGHPTLDVFTQFDSVNPDGLVIYAPHWSFSHPNHENFENYSTFLKNGELILEYAKQHPEIKWVFKPHPSLRLHLHNSRAMTDAEIDAYYAEWERIGTACYTGDYIGLFRESRAMITDCGSFLTEYACTGKPIIHLISSDRKIKTLPPSQELFATYYQAHNESELRKFFKVILEESHDPMRDVRLKAVRNANLVGENASQNILNYIINELKMG